MNNNVENVIDDITSSHSVINIENGIENENENVSEADIKEIDVGNLMIE